MRGKSRLSAKTVWRSNLPSPFVLSCMLIRLVGSCWRAGVDVEHVAAELGDVEPPVAVERHRRGTDDVGVGEHELEAVARGQNEALGLFLRRQRDHRRLRAVVTTGVHRIRQAGTARATCRLRRTASRPGRLAQRSPAAVRRLACQPRMSAPRSPRGP